MTIQHTIDIEENYLDGRINPPIVKIPTILDLVGLYVVQETFSTNLPDRDLRRILNTNLELLAEAEHNDWMEHKRKGPEFSPENCRYPKTS